jgi:hypothetical protein
MHHVSLWADRPHRSALPPLLMLWSTIAEHARALLSGGALLAVDQVRAGVAPIRR